MNRVSSLLFQVSLVAVLIFITLPILVVLAASLSPTSEVTLDPRLWTLRWYGDLAAPRWLEPFWLSVKIAVVVSVISGIAGLFAAYAIVFERFPRSDMVMSFLLAALGPADRQGCRDRALHLAARSAAVSRHGGTDCRPCRPHAAFRDAHGGRIDCEFRSWARSGRADPRRWPA